MKLRDKNEKGIIIISCILTVIIVLGFTVMQGTIKKKEDNYVSKPIKTEISKNDYEVISKKEDKGKASLIVLEKRKFTSDELAMLTSQLIKENTKDFKIYLFDNKAKAKDFEYKNSQTQTVIEPKDENNIEILKYNTVEKEVESKPENYVVESIKEDKNDTKIEISIEKIDKPEKALNQIKFLGESIKKLNSDKKLENLDITAYYNDDKTNAWKYTSENKNIIIHSEIIML